ncbi:MAG: phenylalanine--tRNA ligase subunit beta [Puniceicoccales bacterium]|jgi:phenylalanyl-tRNA synthetase beta chain|nr:phenylalanine--tRNA ligase subunit beta [Puniceicoccales bacterium]
MVKVSLKGLKRFIDLGNGSRDLAETFVKLGLGIESIEHRGFAKNDAVVVGKILNFEKHPNGDRLKVCRVDVGDGNLRQIVCGATNFKQNDCVAVALPGAILPGDIKIKKSKLRGVESEGMLCSSRELGLGSDQSGLLILGQNETLGTKIHDLFPDSDIIFELELTANRGDALSSYGIARELAAWYNMPLKSIEIPRLKQNFSANNDPLEIEIDGGDCDLYAAIVLKNIKIGESVDWIRRDLEAVGMAVVNNIVDVTNWVMVTYGQPLHAFDRAKMGQKIIVRRGKNGEKIATLDGKEYEVTPRTLLICDENHPLAIGGVIGGASTKVTETTGEIVLEGACFSADSIGKTSRALGISTDAAYYYTRHVDGTQTENFLKVAAQMLIDLYGAEPASEILKISKNIDFSPKKIELNPDFVRKIFGFFVGDEIIFDLLTRLKYKVHRENTDQWIVESPSYRWDVTRPIDLVEECLRLYGVDKIPNGNAKIKIIDKTSVCSAQKRRQILQFLADNGFVECYNYSLGKETENALPIANPLIENQTHLRTSLIPGLVDAFRYNLQNGNKYAKFFEFGHVVQKFGDHFEEFISVAFLMPTESLDEHWDAFTGPTFFNGKNLMHRIWNIATDEHFGPIEASKSSLFEEQYSAQIGFLEKTAVEAHVGYLGNKIMKEFQMPLIGGEIFIKIPLFEAENGIKKYQPFSCYPAAKRDISLIVDRSYAAANAIGEIQKMTESIAKDIFTNIEISVFDVYCGENLPDQKKSLGLNLSFKSDKKTPSDREMDQVFQQLIASIRQHARFELRG